MFSLRKEREVPEELSSKAETPVAQWVKHWPADLVVLGSSPTSGEDL